MNTNYEEYHRRLLHESFSNRRILNGQIHRNEHLKKLDDLRKTEPSVEAVLSIHFDKEETTFEMALINLIEILCEEKNSSHEELLNLIQKGK